MMTFRYNYSTGKMEPEGSTAACAHRLAGRTGNYGLADAAREKWAELCLKADANTGLPILPPVGQLPGFMDHNSRPPSPVESTPDSPQFPQPQPIWVNYEDVRRYKGRAGQSESQLSNGKVPELKEENDSEDEKSSALLLTAESDYEHTESLHTALEECESRHDDLSELSDSDDQEQNSEVEYLRRLFEGNQPIIADDSACKDDSVELTVDLDDIRSRLLAEAESYGVVENGIYESSNASV